MSLIKQKYMDDDTNAVQQKFINSIMKAGKKNLARRIFSDTMKEISEKKKDPDEVFQKALDNVSPSMEIKPKRVGGAVYQVPMEVKPERRATLAVRWILDAARKMKGKAMYKKLAQVLMESAEEQGTAFKKKEDTHRMAAANKAFAHFARY